MWLESANNPRIEDGSTALCLVLDGNDLTVANCGDCRAIFCQNGLTQQLTRDHRPTDEQEEERIVQSGGTVIGGRLLGQLGVSRAFGNYEFKDSHLLSSVPEIHHVSVTSEVEILVVGSDGLYDHFSNEEIISFIKNGLNTSSSSLENVVKELVDEAIDRGTDDNITIIVVKFEKAFKKLLKKRAKKQTGKSPTLLSGKSSPLRTSSKNLKHSPDTPQPETSKTSGLFKEVKKGLSLKASVKTSASPVHHSPSLNEAVITHKKKPDPKKNKTIYEEEKWTLFSKPPKPFKHDIFGRTAVTISG
jgi:serine/threonine protein phosphatase PrpC